MAVKVLLRNDNEVNFGIVGEPTGYLDFCVGDIVIIEDRKGLVVKHKDNYGVMGRLLHSIEELGKAHKIQRESHHSLLNYADLSIIHPHIMIVEINEGLLSVIKPDENVEKKSLDYFTEKVNYNTNYRIYYKNPQDTYDDKKFKVFKGKIENFVPTSVCAFLNDNGEMLHVHYRDIIQMSPIKETK